MKQTPLQRKTPMPQRKTSLRQGTPLQRRTELKPGTSELKRTTPMPRSLNPLPAVNKERQARKVEAAGTPRGVVQDIIHARSGGWCELRIPGVCLGRATNIMHRLPEGQGGLYLPANLVDGCGFGNNHGGCHEYQETHRVEARKKGWLVRQRRDPRKRPIHMWIRVGEEWVEGDWLLDDAGGAVPATNTGEAA